MWASWAELCAEILEIEADFRHLLYMMMIVQGSVCLSVLNRHRAKEKPVVCTWPVLDSI